MPHPSTSLHLIADLDRCTRLDDLAWIEELLRAAALAARVTVLDVKLHHFGPGHGVTGVALLAESHISIHTWPETNQAAIDLFVCGERADAQAGLRVIAEGLNGQISTVQEIPRLQGR